jgi:hypothetical protein
MAIGTWKSQSYYDDRIDMQQMTATSKAIDMLKYQQEMERAMRQRIEAQSMQAMYGGSYAQMPGLVGALSAGPAPEKKPEKPKLKTIRQELQAEIDGWLKGVA